MAHKGSFPEVPFAILQHPLCLVLKKNKNPKMRSKGFIKPLIMGCLQAEFKSGVETLKIHLYKGAQVSLTDNSLRIEVLFT